MYECDIYDIQGKKIFDRLRKYYVADASMKQVYFSGYDGYIGKNIENIVYMHLIAYGWRVFVGRIWSLEVDFVCERHGKHIYIQVAYLLATEEVYAREYASLQAIQDNRPKYIVSMDQINVGINKGIEHVQLWMLAQKIV